MSILRLSRYTHLAVAVIATLMSMFACWVFYRSGLLFFAGALLLVVATSAASTWDEFVLLRNRPQMLRPPSTHE